MVWRGCYAHQIEAGSPAWAEAVAELVASSERAKANFEDAGEVCPRCYRHVEDRLEAAKEAVDNLMRDLGHVQERVAPGDEIADFVRHLPRCPRCGLAGSKWRRRWCCKIGRVVGQWEARLVADTLMKKEV